MAQWVVSYNNQNEASCWEARYKDVIAPSFIQQLQTETDPSLSFSFPQVTKWEEAAAMKQKWGENMDK